ncbi:MAG TPA: isoamylase early set domain-containing protein [Anaerolineae bacterium]|nr:isoamylase early set domain-containing protein [Anaerolineae bacterium]
MLKKKFFKTKDECEVTFEVAPEGAEEVALLIDAKEWEPISMKKLKSGTFKTKVRLPKDGEFQFRYLVDNSDWLNDEEADSYVTNEHGSENCVVSTAA